MSVPGVNDIIAAVDLGSNSFHMILGRMLQNEVQRVDRMRERVRLASGLDARHHLNEDVQTRALECLEKFGERVRHLPPGHVRAVGTDTLRKATNSRKFLGRAERVLGHPIEVVSGYEEARLIYLGVVHSATPRRGRRLVIDIGGGSTEIILGEGSELLEAESLDMGCVSYNRRYFPSGKLSKKNFKKAIMAARVELRNRESRFADSDWEYCAGTAGTVHAVADLLRAAQENFDAIRPEGLYQLVDRLVEARSIDNLELAELGVDRKPVIAGGLAILVASFESLKIDRMNAAPGGLREGLLRDLIERFRHEDIRDVTVRRFAGRYQTDEAQGFRVERTALALWQQVATPWEIGDERYRRLLGWASRLHEVGLTIAHSGYHKHGEYLIRNSEMAGFSNDDRIVLASLVRSHRRKIPTKILESLPHLPPEAGTRLCLLLRVAVLLNASRHAPSVPRVDAEATANRLGLSFPDGWLDRHPLTQAELEKEMVAFQRCGHELAVAGGETKTSE